MAGSGTDLPSSVQVSGHLVGWFCPAGSCVQKGRETELRGFQGSRQQRGQKVFLLTGGGMGKLIGVRPSFGDNGISTALGERGVE